MSPFPAGDHKAATNKQDSNETQITKKKIHKRITALERSVRKLMEGSNMFNLYEEGTPLMVLATIESFESLFSISYGFEHIRLCLVVFVKIQFIAI